MSNYEISTEKLSEFLDHHLQPLMKQGELYMKDTGDFLENVKAVGEKFFVNSTINSWSK